MKTTFAAALMMLAVAAVADAAPALLRPDASPKPDAVGVPTTPLGPRAAAVAMVRIEAMPVAWVGTSESRVGLGVSAPRFVTDPYFVQMLVDGDVAAQGMVWPGMSMLLQSEVKSDGAQHELRARVYRDILDGPRVFVKEQAFQVWLPAQ